MYVFLSLLFFFLVPSLSTVPNLVGEWLFSADVLDDVTSMRGSMFGSASIINGALNLPFDTITNVSSYA